MHVGRAEFKKCLFETPRCAVRDAEELATGGCWPEGEPSLTMIRRAADNLEFGEFTSYCFRDSLVALISSFDVSSLG